MKKNHRLLLSGIVGTSLLSAVVIAQTQPQTSESAPQAPSASGPQDAPLPPSAASAPRSSRAEAAAQSTASDAEKLAANKSASAAPASRSAAPASRSAAPAKSAAPSQTAASNTAPAAKPAPQPAATGNTNTRRDGDIVIRNSKQGTTVYDKARGIARISKDVRITQQGEDFILYCQQITYDENKNQAVGTGDVKIETRDSTITGLGIRADFNAKIIVISGNVVMNSHGKSDGIKGTSTGKSLRDEVAHKPSRMTCDRIDYDYNSQEAIVTGHILMTQEKTSGTCERITFDEENNIVKLEGNARFRNAQSQTVLAPNVTIWLDSNMVQSDRGTTFNIPNKNDKPTARPTKAAPPAVPQLPSELYNEFNKPLPAPPAPAKEADDPTPMPATPATPPTAAPIAPTPTG